MMKRVLQATIVAIGLMTLANASSAQEYPTKPITLIVPYTAGSITDVVMRAIAGAASKKLGQPIVVENKAGASGTSGPATMAATAKPDGYTLSQLPGTVFSMPLVQKTSWSADDFTYIVQLSGYLFAVYAGADTPFRTWNDVVEYAKKHPEGLPYATAGIIGGPRLGMEMIAEKAGIKLENVPFKGTSEVAAAVAGGHVMIAAGGLEAKGLADAGKVRYLSVWAEKRSPKLPDVPTLRELGYPFTFDAPFGIGGPRGIDPKIVAKIHDAFKEALQDPNVIETLAGYDMSPRYKNSSDYKASVYEWMNLQAAQMKRLGLLKE